jgi:hypothetical protein
MVSPSVHELSQLRARIDFLEGEHARLMEVTRQQADEIALLRSSSVVQEGHKHPLGGER